MGKKVLIFIILIVALWGGGYYLYEKNQAQAPARLSNSDIEASKNDAVRSQIEPPVTPPTNNQKASTPPPVTNVGSEPIDGNNISVVEVDFDGSKFTPETTNINLGDWVFFKNKSTTDFWPASDPHPAHTGYPGFDAKKAIVPGAQYKFQFIKAGSWGFHDHLNPNVHGVISVSK
jgi:plastocyanin